MFVQTRGNERPHLVQQKRHAEKDRGKDGEVITVDPRKLKVIVSKRNIAKRHSKPRGQGDTGGIKDQELFLPIGKVILICPECKKTTRPKFDELTADLVEITMGPTRQPMQVAGLIPGDIDKVLILLLSENMLQISVRITVLFLSVKAPEEIAKGLIQ